MNFLKKNKTIIIIGIILFCILIGFVLNKKIPKMNKTLPNSKSSLNNNNQKTNEHQILDTHSTTNKPSMNQKYTTSKKSITQADYDQIKSYILSENENEVLTLNDLSQEEKNKIEKFRNSQKQTLEFRKKDQQNIDEKKQECNGYTSQINEIINQIQQLQKQLKPKAAELEAKNKEINKLQLQKQTKTTQLQTQGLPIYQNNSLNKIQEEIDKLEDEKSELIRKIAPIKLQISKLESEQTMYENMLTRTKKFKEMLEKNLNEDLEQNKQSALSSLSSLYEITSDEG
ncbi:MAG: hypothetical protein ACQKHC_02465 [Candidatus Phytoplasma pruni]